VAGLVTTALADAAARAFGAAWETRRRAHAWGWVRPHRVAARVVSVGNLAVGGTGKTTLTLSLARRALAAGRNVAVACKRYAPGPAGRSDEELLYAAALGEARVFAGATKWRLAERAARAGHDLVLVDDAFSHWALARDLDVVLMDADDPWAGGRLLPAGRLREPRRALQRADVVVLSHAADAASAGATLAAIAPWAPSAALAAARHRIAGARGLDGSPRRAEGPAVVVTATGHPAGVERTARAAGYDVVERVTYRDHHWFTAAEAERDLANAERRGATLVLTAKDAVRWPEPSPRVTVLDVEWEWVLGAAAALTRIDGDVGVEAAGANGAGASNGERA
jgi:tetraacyldisaccharide 4'-kinase